MTGRPVLRRVRTPGGLPAPAVIRVLHVTGPHRVGVERPGARSARGNARRRSARARHPGRDATTHPDRAAGAGVRGEHPVHHHHTQQPGVRLPGSAADTGPQPDRPGCPGDRGNSACGDQALASGHRQVYRPAAPPQSAVPAARPSSAARSTAGDSPSEPGGALGVRRRRRAARVGASGAGAASLRMSIRHPVSRAASRAFCPSLPMASESWKSGTTTRAVLAAGVHHGHRDDLGRRQRVADERRRDPRSSR